MIALLACIFTIGVFYAGATFASHGLLALAVASGCFIALGLIVAIAETHGFEGKRVFVHGRPYTWHDLYLDVTRHAAELNLLTGTEKLYIQTPMGIQAVTSVFFARVNHEMSVILEPASADTPYTDVTTGAL